MNDNTQPVPLNDLLDEIEREYEAATNPEHWYALALLVPRLVKVVRRAIEWAEGELSTDIELRAFRSELAQLLREPADSVQDGNATNSPPGKENDYSAEVQSVQRVVDEELKAGGFVAPADRNTIT